MTSLIRPMTPADAAAVARLLPDLGYSATPEQVADRLAALHAWPDQVAWVATDDAGTIVGLCHVQGVRLLASDGYAEIQALVVAKARQGSGIGRSLVAAAIEWAAFKDYDRVRLRSGVQRDEAHAFYESLGFEKARASFAFELVVGDR